MAKILKVELVGSVEKYLHDFKNFGEDVYRDLRDECSVSIDEIDSAGTAFHLRDLKATFVRTAAARVLKIARKCRMDEVIAVTELPEP
ncbi:MAG TPA: hypothetical protein VGE76_19630 [Opitutaceae bacterium]